MSTFTVVTSGSSLRLAMTLMITLSSNTTTADTAIIIFFFLLRAIGIRSLRDFVSWTLASGQFRRRMPRTVSCLRCFYDEINRSVSKKSHGYCRLWAMIGDLHIRHANQELPGKNNLWVGMQSLWCGQPFRDKIVFRSGARSCGRGQRLSGDDDLRKMRHRKSGWLALLRRVWGRDVAGGKIERPYS